MRTPSDRYHRSGPNERWYAERRLGFKDYVRLDDQPKNGFDTVACVIDWLLEQKYIRRIRASDNDEGIARYEYWGTRYYARCDDERRAY